MLRKSTLLFLSVFLLLAFSVSSVAAQCEPNRCDRDGDCFIKNNTPCRNINPPPYDCDDNDFNLTNICVGDTSGDPSFRVDLVAGEKGVGNHDDREVCPPGRSDLVTGIGAAAVPIDDSSRSFVIFSITLASHGSSNSSPGPVGTDYVLPNLLMKIISRRSVEV